jgi:pyruvate dehydrogenase E2 component (dihydrolipoamide acetyltransferase)
VADDGAQSATETARGTVEQTEPSKAQRAVARRVAESKATAPHRYLEADIRVERADVASVVRAVGLALREHPRLNGAYRDGAFEEYSRINVGVVLAGADSPVVPTVFDADSRTVTQIRDELARLVERADAGALTSPELAGGTFTVGAATTGSIRSVTPILNQGQAGALAVGPVTERPVVEEGEVVAGRAMTAVLSCDARIVDSEAAAAFLDRVRALLEGPGELA